MNVTEAALTGAVVGLFFSMMFIAWVAARSDSITKADLTTEIFRFEDRVAALEKADPPASLAGRRLMVEVLEVEEAETDAGNLE